MPAAAAAEAALVAGLEVLPCINLAQVVAHLIRAETIEPQPPREPVIERDVEASEHDLVEVHGQEEARRALEIAAAGGHHLLMSGSPGSGKTPW